MTILYDDIVAYDGGTAQVARIDPPIRRAPPYALISWSSPGLGESFAGVNIYRQAARAPVSARELIGRIRVPPGRSRSEVEAQHRWFADREPHWTSSFGGRALDGHNYWVSYVDTNGVESALALAGEGVEIPSIRGSWLACNTAWWLAAYLEAIPAITADLGRRSFAWELAGRGREVTRTRRGTPTKRASGTIVLAEHVGHDQARMLEAIAASGRQVALCRKLGDRYLGTLEVTGFEELAGARIGASFEFITTGDASQVADYNLPAGIAGDGVDDCAITADHDLLDPGVGSFTFFVAGADILDAGSDYLLSKGVVASGAGFAVRTTGAAGVVEVVARGGSASSTVTATGQSDLFDGFDDSPEGHVIAGTVDVDAGTFRCHVDGVEVGTAQTGLSLGSVSNGRALIAMANNDGADAGTAFATLVHRSHGLYRRALDDVDHARLAGYLRGSPGVRAPGNAAAFYDARDSRSLASDDVLRDISGDTLDAILSGSPAVRGIPAPLGLGEDI